MLLSVFVFSQNSQPKPIQLDNQEGVFITVSLMDSISFKLMDRVALKKENLVLSQVVGNIKLQNEELIKKCDLSSNQVNAYKVLWNKTETQKKKLYESLENQKLITKNIKKKAFRNGLLYFGGGVSVGLVVFVILVK